MSNIRTIKFRGKCIQSGKWIFGFYYYCMQDNAHFILTLPILECPKNEPESQYQETIIVDPKTVGQYVGLKDAVGVDIYEGDILEFDIDVWGGNNNIHIVSWYEKEARWNFGGGLQYSDMQFRKVIGNIHDDPELLPNA